MSFFKSVWIILKRNRVDVWGFWVVVGIAGFSWDDVGEDRFCDCWLAIFKSV